MISLVSFLQSRSSSSATSSSASKPDPDDVEEEEEFEEQQQQQQTIVTNPSRLQRIAPRSIAAPTPMQKSQKSYINNENNKPGGNGNRSKLTSQSPAVGRRNNRVADESPAPSRYSYIT